MKSLLYIAPSYLPASSANSVHVALQTEAYSLSGWFVHVLAATNKSKRHRTDPIEYYSLAPSPRLNFHLIYYPFRFFTTLAIAIYSLYYLITCRHHVSAVHSRNLYLSLLLHLTFPRLKHIHEVHHLEHKALPRLVQAYIFKKTSMKLVFITESLRSIVTSTYPPIYRDRYIVLSDRARPTTHCVTKELQNHLPTIGYFGSVQPDRGISIILELARLHPQWHFLLFGGKNLGLYPQLASQLADLPNISLSSWVPFSQILALQHKCDILLMPYQQQISIRGLGVDTTSYMSPMKMFDYMASSRPFVSSDLPVLREVLRHNYNCLLVKPESIESWDDAITLLLREPELRVKLATNAHAEISQKYNWLNRVNALERFL